jgi:hypothetical protein
MPDGIVMPIEVELIRIESTKGFAEVKAALESLVSPARPCNTRSAIR